MKMKTLQILFSLLVVCANGASGFPADRRTLTGGRDKQASWDDVNVVAHGLLQLGQGLKEHVEKTKAQMRDVNAKLKAFNATVAALERKQPERQDALQARERTTEEGEKMAAEEGERVRAKMEEVKNIQARVDRLEKRVEEALARQDGNQSKNEGMPFIQMIVAAQNRRIDQLVEKIKQQQDKLEKQSRHLQLLQSQAAKKRVKSHRRRHEETTLSGEAKPSDTGSGSAQDCQDLFAQGQKASGVYTIRPRDARPFNVLCEMTPEGGWTVIQKRLDGSQNFNQLWQSYKTGFGNLSGEFWLGLENIHTLSKQGRYLLQVEVTDWAGQTHVSRYGVRVDGEQDMYALHLEPDSLSGAQERPGGASVLRFSTADNDNDQAADLNCAELLSGGWWFRNCGPSNLNGKFPRTPSLHPRTQGMFWLTAEGQKTSVKATVLKMAPVTVKQ